MSFALGERFSKRAARKTKSRKRGIKLEGNFNGKRHGEYFCEYCPRTFKYLANFQHHIENQVCFTGFSCKHCGKEVSTKVFCCGFVERSKVPQIQPHVPNHSGL